MDDELATCAQHGLRYDPKLNAGCVMCRRGTAGAPSASSRRRLFIYLALGLVVAGAGLGMWAYRVHARNKAEKIAAGERATRQTPVATIAPAPLPTSLPLLGSEGKDADGYPTQYVDRPALRSLLAHGRYAELTGYIEQFQTAFESDPTHEFWPEDATATFSSAEAEVEPQLDDWVKTTPDSFAPYLARGAHWAAVAFARRGSKFRSETPESSLDAMKQTFVPAQRDLEMALAKRPKLVAALTEQIEIAKNGPRTKRGRELLDKAIAICPTCFVPRTTYMHAIEPRWGGSYDAMAAFARESATFHNPRLRLLAGYADLDRARVLERNKKYEEALATIQRACALSDWWTFLDERATIEGQRGDMTTALADYSKALAVRPGVPTVLFDRVWAESTLKQFEPAGRDLLDGLRVDPTNDYGRSMLDSVVRGLDYAGWQSFQAGRHDESLRLYDLAANLAPNDTGVLGHRVTVIQSSTMGAPSDIDALQAAADAAPDDFEAHRRLDYALAKQRNFDRVITVWSSYIAVHPGEGRAYLERGGAYFNLRRMPEAYADASKACELGVSEGCVRARQIGQAAH
jgi:tetratricopeptide (TPR) repeat protein